MIDLSTLRPMGAAILEPGDAAAIRWLQLVAPLFPPHLGECVVFVFSLHFTRIFALLCKVSSNAYLYLIPGHHKVHTFYT